MFIWEICVICLIEGGLGGGEGGLGGGGEGGGGEGGGY
jgi:Predicted membrane protein